MTFRATGFIVGKRDFRSYDRMFTIYSREFGKLQAMGQATRKLESKLSGNLELLNFAVFTIAKGKTVDRIATVDIKNSFESFKGNLEKLVVALHCIEVVDQLVKWEQPDVQLFELLDEFLATLSICPDGRRVLVGRAFLFKLFFVLGYLPSGALVEQLSFKSLEDISLLKGAGFEKSLTHCLREHIEKPLKSQEYFDFLAGTKS
jgi:DNA repair protein RecO (recombination protein O)